MRAAAAPRAAGCSVPHSGMSCDDGAAHGAERSARDSMPPETVRASNPFWRRQRVAVVGALPGAADDADLAVAGEFAEARPRSSPSGMLTDPGRSSTASSGGSRAHRGDIRPVAAPQ